MYIRPLIALTLAAVVAAAPVWAQHSVIRPADLRATMAEKAASEAAERELVTAVLKAPEVRELAAQLSLDLTRAEQAVATLSEEDLEAAAATARAIQQDLAGESHTVTISVTTLLLILIIVILLAN